MSARLPAGVGPLARVWPESQVREHGQFTPVLRAAKAGPSNLTFVTTDLFPELVEWIRAGQVAATMPSGRSVRDACAAGALSIPAQHPASKLRVVLHHVVMRSNLDQFLERLSVDVDLLITPNFQYPTPKRRPTIAESHTDREFVNSTANSNLQSSINRLSSAFTCRD
jgi:hypothetical protein